MTREEALRIAKESKELSKYFDSTEFVERNTAFFEHVIKELERTAPEVPVQEQRINRIVDKRIKKHEEVQLVLLVLQTMLIIILTVKLIHHLST